MFGVLRVYLRAAANLLEYCGEKLELVLQLMVGATRIYNGRGATGRIGTEMDVSKFIAYVPIGDAKATATNPRAVDLPRAAKGIYDFNDLVEGPMLGLYERGFRRFLLWQPFGFNLSARMFFQQLFIAVEVHTEWSSRRATLRRKMWTTG